MSGNFVQRGEPAIYDKFVRTRCALLNGADLVIELPVFFAAASAPYFARAAVDILNAAGITDSLCFGAEEGQIENLSRAADMLSQNNRLLNQKIKEYLSGGVSYPKALGKALESAGADASLIKAPNNILGVEYLRALKESGSAIVPYCVKRKSAAHHDAEIQGSIASAVSIRKRIITQGVKKIKGTVPPSAYRLYLSQGTAHYYDKMSQLFQYKIKTSDAAEIEKIFDVTEGLENRIIKSAARNAKISALAADIKTKRYTYAKIRRVMLYIILNITKDDIDYALKTSPAYIRVLGFRKDSEAFSRVLKHSKVPVITNLKKAEKQLEQGAFALLEKELEPADIYYLTNNYARPKRNDYHVPMVIV